MPAEKLPRLVRVLASIGVLLGVFNSMSAVLIGRLFLIDHDHFIEAFREQAELTGEPSPSPSASPLASPVPELSPSPMASPSAAPEAALFTKGPSEQMAEKLYSQKGVVLPVSAIALIVFTLLLVGCLRALRGSAWGLSAWNTACLAALPFEVLAAVSIGDLNELPKFMLVGAALRCVYYVVCLLHLRRKEIRERFR